MTTKTAEPIDLPPPVAAYFAADTTDAKAVAQCFNHRAVVIDERQEYRGRAAIARWKAEAPSNFRYSVERLGGRVSNQITVTGRVTGTSPPAPSSFDTTSASRATRLLGSRSRRELRS